MNKNIGLRTECRGLSVERCVLSPQSSVLSAKSSAPSTRQRGFTLLEMIVVISLIAILAGMLLQRVWLYQEQAEKAAMEQMAGALQTALVLQYAQFLTHGQESEIKTLTSENPLRWLMQKPGNYVGEFYGVSAEAVAPGSWAFDLKSRELVYVPYRAEYLLAGPDGHKWVRYHARLQYEGRPRGGKSSGAVNNSHELTGVLFEPVVPFQWFLQGK